MSGEKKIWAKKVKNVKDKSSTPLSLSEHIQDLLSKFEDLKKYVPAKLHKSIETAIYLHDIGKVLPKFQRNKIGNKEYQPFDVEIDLDHSLFSTALINKNELVKELGNEDYANFTLSAVAFHHWRDRFEEIIRFGSEKFKKFRDKPQKFKEALIENLMIETKNLKDFNFKLIELDEFMIEGLADGVPFDSYVAVPYQLYFLPQRLENDDEKKKDWLLISGFLMRCDHFA